MKILNLGCGVKTSSHPGVVNLDWSYYLRLKQNPLLRPLALCVLRGVQLQRFKALPDNIMVHNLAKGIPFPDASVDVVYHSHLLEHLDREVAELFVREVWRVLKPGGVQRIAVPDLERLCRDYLEHLALCDRQPSEAERHDDLVAALLEQSVRKTAFSTRLYPPLRRRLENWLLGDARRRGETHQWMYDRVNLSVLLRRVGFRDPVCQAYNTSQVAAWNEVGLDLDERGGQYKPDSFYLEATK
jgi:SAM-dependent methyltransferase